MGHKELDMTEHAHTVYGSRVTHEFLHERIYTQAPALGPGSHVLAHLCVLAIVWQSAMYRHRPILHWYPSLTCSSGHFLPLSSHSDACTDLEV